MIAASAAIHPRGSTGDVDPRIAWKTSSATPASSAKFPALKTNFTGGDPAEQRQRERRDDQPGDNEVARRGEDQSERQRQLGEGEGVGLLADLEVHVESLGGEERQREQRPRDLERLTRRADRAVTAR